MKDYSYLDEAAEKLQDPQERAEAAETESLKKRLRDYVEMITERNGKTKLYNCPLCGSGTHANGTGAFSIYTGQDGAPLWKCHACGKWGDIFQLIAEHENIKDFTGQLSRARELFGATPARKLMERKPEQKKPISREEVESFCKAAAENINAPEAVAYMKSRGLDVDKFKGLEIGYCAEWRGADGQHAPSARLIMPFDNFSGYLARTLTAAGDGKGKIHIGRAGLFGGWTLTEQKPPAAFPVFIVEGAFDAMSIIQAGGYACALNSANNSDKLLSFLDTAIKDGEQVAPLILALDNDAAGRKVQAGLAADLTARSIFFREVSADFYTEDEKDANALLMAGASALEDKIKHEEYLTEEALEAAAKKEEAKEAAEAEQLTEEAAAYMDSFNGGKLAGFWEEINQGRKEYISTGFPALDNALDGGIYPRLHIIGAVSSLGKTTFFIQLIDQLAQQGLEVLFFSLETPLKSIMAKSISRHTYIISSDHKQTNYAAKTERDIINSGLREWTEAPGHLWGQEDFDIIKQAGEAYAAYANNIKVYDTRMAEGVAGISAAIDKHIKYTGRTPGAVFVDYLQLIPAPQDTKPMTDKERADYNSAALVDLSRKYNIPVFCISSLNRASYTQPVELDSFKESGGIEYNSDVLMGLQYSKIEPDTNNFKAAEERGKVPRDITLKIIKNRGGASGAYIRHEYNAAYNFFDPGKIYNPIETAKEEKSARADEYRKTPRRK